MRDSEDKGPPSNEAGPLQRRGGSGDLERHPVGVNCLDLLSQLHLDAKMFMLGIGIYNPDLLVFESHLDF